MSRSIQIRDIPDNVHSVLKARAACAGIGLAAFVKRELERIAERTSMQEWLEKTAQAKPIASKTSAAQMLRDLRG